MFDLGLRCDYLLTLDNGDTTCLRDYFVGISNAVIKTVAPWQDNFSAQCQQLIHAKNQLVMPGLVNTHCHVPMTLFRGLAEDQTFEYWLHKIILPLEAQLVDPEFVAIGTELALLESLQSGVTTICDMYYFTDAIAEVFDRVGVRGMIGQTIFDFSAPDNKTKNANDYAILDKLRATYSDHPYIYPAVAPHAPYTCSDETLKKARDYAQKYSLHMTSHVAETPFETEQSLKQFSLTPVERYANLGLLELPSVYAHCVALSDNDIALLGNHHIGVAYNAESNMKLGSGIASIQKLIDAGCYVGIGTDGPASNNDLNLLAEMSTGIKLQKLIQHQTPAITAKTMVKMATIEGARALGLEKQTGSISVGKFADCIILNLNLPELYPHFDLISHLVYAMSHRSVETVICHGKILLEKQQSKTIDSEQLFAKVNGMAEKINQFLKLPPSL